MEPTRLHRSGSEHGRSAQGASNEQPCRFLVGTRGSEAYRKIFDTLVPFNQLWAASAPVLILDVTKTKFSRNDTPNRAALYDLGAAASYLTLQASALGLATHQMGGFDADAARKAFGIPDDYIIGAVIALGYQGEPDDLPNDQLRNQEKSPRSRKPLNEFVFSAWDQAADLA
jgi:nitroreductase